MELEFRMANFEIFVLDDEPDLAELFAEFAESVGLTATSFSNPFDALQALERNQPRALVLDLIMPNMDGVEFIKQMDIAGYNDVQLILISGIGQDVLRVCKETAAERSISVIGILSKPVSRQTVLDMFSKIQPLDIREDAFYHTDSSSVSIEDGKITTYYQPQVDLYSKEIIGFEALARLNHDWLGLVRPDTFIPKSEDSNEIQKITELVVQDIFDRLHLWGTSKAYPVSINVSPTCAASDFLPKLLLDLSAQYGVSPKDITIELTETAAVTDMLDSIETLTSLRLKGFRLSIDDFGTGVASLEKLHKIPFNELKIDRTFVAKTLHDTQAAAIVETSILLAHRLGMTTVAEGIETEEEMDIMSRLGCNSGQGFYISHPMPLKNIADWEREWKLRHNL